MRIFTKPHAAILGIVIAASMVLPTTTSYADTRVVPAVTHYLQCLDWLVNNQALWNRNCQPSRPAGEMEGPSPDMTNPVPPPSEAPAAPSCTPWQKPSYGIQSFSMSEGGGSNYCKPDFKWKKHKKHRRYDD